jgi:hypothetical protein
LSLSYSPFVARACTLRSYDEASERRTADLVPGPVDRTFQAERDFEHGTLPIVPKPGEK